MSDSRRRRKAKQARRDVRRTSRRRREEARDEVAEELPLIVEVQEALAAEHPLHLLGLVAMIVEASLPAPALLDTSEDEDPDSPGLDDLVESFIGVPVVETTALLGVLAELADDPELGARCAAEVDRRDDELPSWITDLAQTTVYRAVRMTHVLGDGDDLMLGVRLPAGYELTCVVFIDHNAGSAVGDAFLVPDSLAAVLEVAEQNRTDSDLELVEMTPADAAAWLSEGLAAAEALWPPAESDTWPACRPLVEWLFYSMPTGGRGYPGRSLGFEEQQGLLARFFGSLVGMRFDTAEHRRLLESCIARGTGDPLRFSEVRLTDLLTAPLFDGVGAPPPRREDLPDLLRAYVPFAHAEAGLRDELSVEALAAIDACEPEYRARVGG